MNNYLKKIWKDSVLSKVISAGILALITILYNITSSLITKRTFKQEFINLWTLQIELWYIVILLIIMLSLFYMAYNTFKYDDDTLALDRKLFTDIRNMPFMTEFILEVKSNGFSSRPVKADIIDVMISLKEESKKSDFEFINPQLEKLKLKLIKDLDHLDDTLFKYIFGANMGWVSIPSEWEINNPERHNEAKVAIAYFEDQLTGTFQEFISKGRRILKV